jgi:hypothetical protein
MHLKLSMPRARRAVVGDAFGDPGKTTNIYQQYQMINYTGWRRGGPPYCFDLFNIIPRFYQRSSPYFSHFGLKLRRLLPLCGRRTRARRRKWANAVRATGSRKPFIRTHYLIPRVSVIIQLEFDIGPEGRLVHLNTALESS